MEQILLPNSIEFINSDVPNMGKMVITPCHQGYGTTLGNALRRVLLSSLPGAAVESIKIKGVQHEFSSMEGVLEDTIEIILNIKELAVKSYSAEPVTLSLSKKGIGDITAGDFEKNSDIEIVNPDLKIATVTDKDLTFEMDIIVGQGRGYLPVAEKETKNLDLGTIAVDSLYTPIRDVGYSVEMTRVGDVTDYEKLTLSIETNGAITPKEAVSQATKILTDHFFLVAGATEKSNFSELSKEAVPNLKDDSVDLEVEEVKKEVKKEKKAKKKETEVKDQE